MPHEHLFGPAVMPGGAPLGRDVPAPARGAYRSGGRATPAPPGDLHGPPDRACIDAVLHELVWRAGIPCLGEADVTEVFAACADCALHAIDVPLGDPADSAGILRRAVRPDDPGLAGVLFSIRRPWADYRIAEYEAVRAMFARGAPDRAIAGAMPFPDAGPAGTGSAGLVLFRRAAGRSRSGPGGHQA